MLELILIVFFILWVTGAFIVPFGGSAIHILLVVCLVLLVIRLLRGSRDL